MLTIDSELQALIPPLQAEERDALEASILTEGCRDAIVVWHHDGMDIIVDGHNRHAICTAHGLPYNVVTRDFSSRSDVKLWMIRNQLARRNLTPFKRTELALQMEAVIADQARANMAAGGLVGANITNRGLHNSANPEPINTRKEVGRIAEVSHDTVRKVKNVLEAAPAPIVDKARAGDISIHAAERITKALQGLPDDVVEVALRLADDSADKVEILHSLHKSNGRDGSNQTFDEITRNGGFHYGDEMDEWCDFASSSVSDIRRALASVAKYHAVVEQQAKDAARETTKPKLSKESLKPTIYCASADNMPIADNTIDLIITSPPYNMGSSTWNMGGQGRTQRVSGIGYEDNIEEHKYQQWQIDCLMEMHRVAKSGASLFYNHKERYKDGVAIIPTDWLRDSRQPWVLRQTIVWDRGSTHNHNAAYFYPETEYVYWLTKGKPTLPDRPIGLSCVWRQHGPVPNTWHPAPFTESLPDMLLQAIGRNEKMTVLDPFAGSGTTLASAIKYGYDAIGVEINADYIAKMKDVHQWT